MRTVLQSRLEELAQDLASSILAAVRRASLADLGDGAPEPDGASRRNGRTGDDLQPFVDGALKAMKRQRVCEADVACQLALLARAAHDARGTLAACAQALGVSRQTLQPYTVVARQWTGAELQHLLAVRRNSKGEPISMSHLLLVANWPRPECDRVVERVFSEALTVRQLRRIVRGTNTSPPAHRAGRGEA